MNQIVVCSNTTSSLTSEEFAKNLIKSIIQSYDYCRAYYNMFDHKHLACSQVCQLNAFSNKSFIFSFKKNNKNGNKDNFMPQ